MKKLMVLMVLLLSSVCDAATYYVSTDGSGSTCSSGSPCSITYAMANAVAGDTWILASGIYNAGTGNGGDMRTPLLNPSNSGYSGNPIIFQSATPLGAEITCTSNPNYCVPIGSSYRNYITFDGLKIYSPNGAAEVWFSHNSTGCTIKNSEIIK